MRRVSVAAGQLRREGPTGCCNRLCSASQMGARLRFQCDVGRAGGQGDPGHSGKSWVVGLRGCQQQVGVARWSLVEEEDKLLKGVLRSCWTRLLGGSGARGVRRGETETIFWDQGGLIYCPVMLSKYSAFRQLLPTAPAEWSSLQPPDRDGWSGRNGLTWLRAGLPLLCGTQPIRRRVPAGECRKEVALQYPGRAAGEASRLRQRLGG